ncbi:hypothetical protein ACH5RR_040835 [Cinchona calisaya]|uniref:Retrovirus-related Pol polyprotein from transposon TNT 1-94-like beta-barrel domain-containing protein n=1 Tax=Cinchona calisaya TaxID=153742 RepID=A0ABD2XT10_9GENT
MAKIEDIKGHKAIKDGTMTIAINVVNESDEDWDVQVSFTVEECAFCCTTDQKDELALTTVNTNPINYNVDWMIDSGCSSHMTGDKRKLTNLTEYKGGRVVVTADNSKLPITHIGNVTILPRYKSHQVELQHVYHVPGMKKNLLSVSQLIASGNFLLLGPDEVKLDTPNPTANPNSNDNDAHPLLETVAPNLRWKLWPQKFHLSQKKGIQPKDFFPKVLEVTCHFEKSEVDDNKQPDKETLMMVVDDNAQPDNLVVSSSHLLKLLVVVQDDHHYVTFIYSKCTQVERSVWWDDLDVIMAGFSGSWATEAEEVYLTAMDLLLSIVPSLVLPEHNLDLMKTARIEDVKGVVFQLDKDSMVGPN